MKKGLIVLAFAFLFAASFASAEILISQPASTYNYGDVMNVSITVVPQAAANDYLSVKLICDGKEAEIHRAIYELAAGENKAVYLLARLDSAIIGDVAGNCFIKASYAGEEKDSQYFIITKNVDVIATIDGSFIEPGNEFGVSGRAIKTNGELLNGFVEFSSKELNIATSEVVSNGDFRVNLTVPSDAMPGDYLINIKAYEKDSNGVVSNEGGGTVGL
ncbi:MAG: hypothetical protein PHH00_04395, partial [Candidatus Nanoarchaeia archaeon]|nr:hypothetical protein [Candidatus Nanoarchaeia archaeon]